MHANQANQALDGLLDKLPTEIRADLKNKLLFAINYTPKIGIMGTSGAGKSSLINAIVGKEVCKTGGVGGCTRAFQEERFSIGRRDIIFMDLPGIAESQKHHSEYEELYAKKLPELDVILWVIKVDDRATKADEDFYKELLNFYRKDRILFVLSQCDKAEPSREWNYEKYLPSEKQLEIIEKNHARIVNDFDVPPNTVIPVACSYYNGKFDRYNMELLIKAIVQTVPNEAKSSLISGVDKDNVSEESKQEAKSGFAQFVSVALDAVIDELPIAKPVREIAKKAKNWLIEKVSSLWDTLF